MAIQKQTVGNLTINSSESYDEVVKTAYQTATAMCAELIPVIIYRQGVRYSMSGVLTFSSVARSLFVQSAEKKSTIGNAATSTNRPEVRSHTNEIAKYLKKNHEGKYTLGALTLNIQQPLSLFTVEDASPIKTGFLILPKTGKISITDGQHRQSAIKKLLEDATEEEQAKLAIESIAVIITNENDISQIHQDFADASKIKPLPQSLITIYDSRNPANRAVLTLENRCDLFKGRIDSVSRYVPKGSNCIFTAKQLLNFLKHFMVSDSKVTNAKFEKLIGKIMGDEDVFESEIGKAIAYIQYLTDKISIWNKISKLAPGLPATKISDYRSEGHICLTSVGLGIIGRIGNTLFKNELDWKMFSEKLAGIDWSPKSPLWEGCSANNTPSMNAAIARVMNVIEMPNDSTLF